MCNAADNYRVFRWFGGAACLLVGLLACHPAAEKIADRQLFASPQQGVTALLATVENNDDAGLLAMLGADAEDLIFSGDPVADLNGRKRFLAAFAEQHRLEQEGDERALLILGSRDYPFPIPLRRQDSAWYFDTAAGREEILNRRIGRNELHTIEVLKAYTEAQREYACLKHKNGGPEFARRLTSSEGKKDGLYWPAAAGEQESPFGPLIARATEEGYSGALDEDPPEAFHGYYFKILTAQGPHARGGAFDYVAGGRMVLGFALVAYPAKYGASGVMTFIVNQEGAVYEKDLGKDTAETALTMTDFDPDPSWRKFGE